MCPDRDRAAKLRADGNVRKIADAIIMLHDGSGVDDAVLADARTYAAARDTAPTYNNLGSGKGSVLEYIFITK